MRLPPSALLLLFAIGAAAGLVGDQGHVKSGTGRYLSDAVPFVWESAFWFPVLVGLGTVTVAVVRLRLGPVAGGLRWADAVAGIAAVIGLYALTALIFGEPLSPATVLCFAIATIICARVGGGMPALVCGVSAAIVGTVVEIVLVEIEAFEYAPSIDTLGGVPPWLPALYLAFGVVVARLAELLAVGEPTGSR